MRPEIACSDLPRVSESCGSPVRALLASSARAALLDALMLPVKALDACTVPFLVATANQASSDARGPSQHTYIHFAPAGCSEGWMDVHC
eukprot:4892328-Pleurochrysis_carterae.AAC.1